MVSHVEVSSYPCKKVFTDTTYINMQLRYINQSHRRVVTSFLALKRTDIQKLQ